jgi:hypothetical protein
MTRLIWQTSAVLFLFSVIINAQDVSIFGITLGKSLQEVGIKECARSPIITLEDVQNNTRPTKPDNICYYNYRKVLYENCLKTVSNQKYCQDEYNKDRKAALEPKAFSLCVLSHLQVVIPEMWSIGASHVCSEDFLPDKPVLKMGVGFPSEYVKTFFDLLVNKFGKPTTLNFSKVQNPMGAVFDDLEATWNIGGNLIELHERLGANFTKGHMEATYKDEPKRCKKLDGI